MDIYEIRMDKVHERFIKESNFVYEVKGKEIIITLPDIDYDFNSSIIEPDQQLCHYYGIEFEDVKSKKRSLPE